jgi:hypothetical protein
VALDIKAVTSRACTAARSEEVTARGGRFWGRSKKRGWDGGVLQEVAEPARDEIEGLKTSVRSSPSVHTFAARLVLH